MNKSRIRNIFAFFVVAVGIILNPWVIGLLLGRHNGFRFTTNLKIIVIEVPIIAFGIAMLFFYDQFYRNVKQHWKYLIFVCCFSIFSLEIMIRLLFPNQYPTFSNIKGRYQINGNPSMWTNIYAPSDYAVYALKKNLNLDLADTLYGYTQHIVTNNDGFRNQEKTDGGIHIMMLGDSVTFGMGVNDAETFPAQLQDLSLGQYQVSNFGIPGWGPAEYYLTYRWYVSQVKPNLIIIGLFPANDFSNLDDSTWTDKDTGSLPTAPIRRKDFFLDKEQHVRSSNYLYKIPILRDSATFVFFWREMIYPLVKVLRRTSPVDSKELTLKIINDISKNAGCKVLILLLPAQYHYPDNYQIDDFRHRLEKSDNKVYVIDFYPIIRERYADLYADSDHFNREGNYIIAHVIYNFINENKLILTVPDESERIWEKTDPHLGHWQIEH